MSLLYLVAKRLKGNRKRGVKARIEVAERDFNKKIDLYKQKNDELFKQIEALLPGATSAGLAKAYDERLIASQKAKVNYTRLFYGSIIALICVVSFSDMILAHSFGSMLMQNTNIIQRTFAKMILMAPFIWAASFASNRANEMTRLAEEYGHKKALAQSYYGFKRQIETLQGEGHENNAVAQQLLEGAVKNLVYNASSSLDKAKRENHPFIALITLFIGNKGEKGQTPEGKER